MEQEMLRVNMLGRFSVYYGDVPIVREQSRNSKVIQLLEYLLVNRDRPVSQEELIETLLPDADSENLTNVLKNLVYRLRKLFLVEGVPDEEFIYYQKGCYGFTAAVPAWIDAEVFGELARKSGEEEDSESRRLEAVLEAVSLYEGDFLPRLSGEPWALVRMVRYQDIYRDCVQLAYGLLADKGDHFQMLALAQRASRLYPFEEMFHRFHISCLFELGRYREALIEYEVVTNMLMDELGIDPGQGLQDLYQNITACMQPFADSLVEIRKGMGEEQYKDGAYYCNYYDFTSTYRFIVRHMERGGQSAYLMLCSMIFEDKERKEGERQLEGMAASFLTAAEQSLRRGDVCTRYSASQFLLLLLDVNRENCHLVAKRLRANFYKGYRGKDITFYYKIISVADVDRMMEGGRIDGNTLRWGIKKVSD